MSSASLQAQPARNRSSYEDVIASRLLSRDGDRVQRVPEAAADQGDHRHLQHGTSRGIPAARRDARIEPQRRDAHRRAGRRRHAGGAREDARTRTAATLWRLNAYWRFEQSGGRRADRVRVGQPEPRRSCPAPAVHLGHRRGRRARVAGADADQRAQHAQPRRARRRPTTPPVGVAASHRRALT